MVTWQYASEEFYEHLGNKIRENECGLFNNVLGTVSSGNWETGGTPNHPPVKGGPYARRRTTWYFRLQITEPNQKGMQAYAVPESTTAVCYEIFLERLHGRDGKHTIVVPCWLTTTELLQKKDAIINEVFAHWKHTIAFEKELELRAAQFFGTRPEQE